MSEIFPRHLSYRDVPCRPGCVADHTDDDPGFLCCRTVWINTLPPYPNPRGLTVGSLRAVGPSASAAMDESWRVTLTRDGADDDVLAPSAWPRPRPGSWVGR